MKLSLSNIDPDELVLAAHSDDPKAAIKDLTKSGSLDYLLIMDLVNRLLEYDHARHGS